MTPINVKRGDTNITLYLNSDLTGATLRVPHRVSPSGPVTLLTGTVTNSTTGEVRIDTSALAVGTYQLEVEVTVAGATYTYPDDEFITLNVNPDLG